jgi:aerobic carbon-monoxide dehydrogenase medium subunit
MTPFQLLQPATLREAASLLEADDPGIRPMGGGTALMLMMKAGVLKPRALVSLRGAESQFKKIALQPDGELRIGALVTMSQLEHSPEVRRAAPAIARCMTRLSNVRVRNVATVGGNLAHADPHMDLPPLLAALDAAVIVTGPAGERRIPVDALIKGYYETVLAGNELIATLVVPPQEGLRSAYAKVTTRSADDWPALGVAASLRLDRGQVRACRLFVGAATDRPTRLAAAEAVLTGRAADAATLKRAADAAVEEVDFMADAQGSAAYKKELLRVHLVRVVQSALAAEPGNVK